MKNRRYPLFVYGTLKPGEENYHRYMAGRTRNEQPATLARAALYTEGVYPYLVIGDSSLVGDDDTVDGYLMTVQHAHDDAVLRAVDRLEDYVPGRVSNTYERVTCTVTLDSGEAVLAWTYVAGRRTLTAIRTGQFERVPHRVWHPGLRRSMQRTSLAPNR